MISISLMTDDQSDALKTSPDYIPRTISWINYWKASHTKAGAGGYWLSFAITFTNVLFSIVTKIFITMLAGYAFSIKTWKGKKILWNLFIMLLVLPEVALLTGQYIVITRLDQYTNIKKTFMGIVAVIALPFIASIFNALMFRNAFESIPSRIKEVAMIDGAVGPRYFFKIAAPMVTPTTLTIIILTALASWNSYLWPALVSSNQFSVMSVWIFNAGVDPDQPDKHKVNLKMAAAVLAILPMFFTYFIFRKRIMTSISRQGSTIKG